MRCPNCGKEIDAGTKFCTNCGAPAPTGQQNIEPRKAVVRQKSGGMSPAILALIIVCVVAVMAAAGFGIGKLISNNSSDTTAETSESQSSDSGFKDYSASEDDAEEVEDVEFEGVDDSNIADYSNVLKASDYVTFEDGEFTFIYPKNFYNSAKCLKDDSGTTYVFDANDGSRFVVGKHKEEGDGKQAVQRIKTNYSEYLSSINYYFPLEEEGYEFDDAYAGKDEKKGSYFGVVSGPLAEDSAYQGYKEVTYENGVVYEMEIITPESELESVDKDKGGDMQVGNGDYLIDCLYVGMSKTLRGLNNGKPHKDKETYINSQK